MNESVIAFYRRLLKEDFPNSGLMENPSVFVEAVGERLINCGNTGNYMQLYLRIAEGRITDITYLCACEPVANVAVEILCDLVKGKTVEEATAVTEECFYLRLGSRDDELSGKAAGLLELLREGLGGKTSSEGGSAAGDGKTNWDDALSS